MVTEKLPVKGNKKLIQQLEADHYWVQKWLNTIPGTPRQYVFRVCKTVTISTGRADRIGRDLVDLERKLYDGAAVCVSDLTARQADHLRDHFGGLLKHTCKEALKRETEKLRAVDIYLNDEGKRRLRACETIKFLTGFCETAAELDALDPYDELGDDANTVRDVLMAIQRIEQLEEGAKK